VTEHLNEKKNHATSSLPSGTLCRVRGSTSRYQDSVVLVLDTGQDMGVLNRRVERLWIRCATFRGTAKFPLNELRPVTAVERLGFLVNTVVIKVPIMAKPIYGGWQAVLITGFGEFEGRGDDEEAAVEKCLEGVRSLIDAPAGVEIVG
jgi:hypothetical protein